MVVAVLACALTPVARAYDLAGRWEFTVTQFGEPEVGRLILEATDSGFKGRWHGLDFQVSLEGNAVQIKCSYEENKQIKSCGALTGTLAGSEMSGSGKLFDDPETWTAHRIVARTDAAPKSYEFVPKEFHRQFSGGTPAALHIYPGDSVHTKSVDSGGVDETGTKRSPGGNPLTGPFYIEGALPGDTLAVHLKRVRLNRDTAGIYNNSVVSGAVDPDYLKEMKAVEGFDSTWKLNREEGTATLSHPTERLKNLRVRLQPMLGCIGVAPPGYQAFGSGYLGSYGGNMDYSQIREGTTVYLPVYQAGAILFMGDGHAVQGDGELTGNALETSMEIEFSVDLIEGKSLGQPWAENDEYVMVMGIEGSLNEALQTATTGLSRWLEEKYKLNTAEIAMLLGSSMRYDIAEIVDPRVHIVAKLSKAMLAQVSNSQ
jgi:acetamidase/formamidase